MLWLVAFLSFLIPSGVMAQTQDIHALRIVTQTFEKAKKDNKTRQDTLVVKKTHRIENLNNDGEFKSVEKQMVYKAYGKDGKNGKEYVEELVDIWPSGAEPAANPLDFDKLLDAFLSHFYFSINPEREVLDGRTCLKIHFWPREDPPLAKENADYLVNNITGVLYVDEETLALRRIGGHLKEVIDESPWFHMEKFDFLVEIRDWKGLGLVAKMNAATKYQYRDPRKSFWSLFSPVKRHQTHQFWHEYSNSE
ncbi:MAG: hypothetical protein HYT67_00340 [Candidatus Yanofskybacteria bacterium]|nr:hypothetical protein [Candidatus Yanofskybacteria bacterium]